MAAEGPVRRCADWQYARYSLRAAPRIWALVGRADTALLVGSSTSVDIVGSLRFPRFQHTTN